MSDEIVRRLEFARAIAREAGRLTLRYFLADELAVERKHDDSPVTIADRQSEQLLRERIAQQFASDGILGEEFGEGPARAAIAGSSIRSTAPNHLSAASPCTARWWPSSATRKP
jgi:fructose-1,6-bisphosphatase/inositol monophosphatase family enzyme